MSYFEEQVSRVPKEHIEGLSTKDVEQFIKDVYEFCIPEGKEAGEHAFHTLDYIAMEELAAFVVAHEVILQARVAELEMALSQIASGDGQYGQQAGEYKAIARKVLENYS